MKTIVSALVALSVVVGLVDPVGRGAVSPSAATLATILFDVAERYDP